MRNWRESLENSDMIGRPLGKVDLESFEADLIRELSSTPRAELAPIAKKRSRPRPQFALPALNQSAA
jgi:hypothetical protein